MRKLFFVAALFCVAVTNAQNRRAPQLGKDPINKVVSAMTLEEKAYLLNGGSYEITDNKVGKHIDNVIGAAGMTIAIPSLGIPATVLTDGPAGVRIPATRKETDKTFNATGFPISTLLASTWNKSVCEAVGKAMGNETLEFGCDVLLAPGVNIHRNPLCGRNFEYLSEDPLLSGELAAAIINGVQSEGVGVSIKHFAANNQQSFRLKNDARISQRALREIYLKSFEIALKYSAPWTLMSSYNKINGTFTQESYPLLTTVLRDEWGYDGLIMTDWTAPRNTDAQIHAGNDLLMWGSEWQANKIIEDVKNGSLSMADVDKNVRRMLEYILKIPSFKKYNHSDTPDLKAHAKLVRSSADEGIVLLENKNKVLPLSDTVKNVAMFGIGSYYFYSGGLGAGDVNTAYVVDMKKGLSNAGYTINAKLDGLYKKYIDCQECQLNEVNTKTRDRWWGFIIPNEMDINPTYVNFRTKESDMAVITFSREAGEVSDRFNKKGDFMLSDTERSLLNNVTAAFHAVGKKVVVVLNTGGVMETASWKNVPDAVLLAWQPGQEGGNSVMDIFRGDVNPSGKLPMTFPVDYRDIPSSKNFPDDHVFKTWDEYNDTVLINKKNLGYTNYEEGIWIGYRYFDTYNKAVSYPFGYGISYTTFDYGMPKIRRNGNKCVVELNVRNTGSVAGKEVVQLYVTAPKTSVERPARELKSFAKTALLAPGLSERVKMTFDISELSYFDEASNSWVLDAGTYSVQVGSSVEDIRCKAPLKIKNRTVRFVKAKI